MNQIINHTYENSAWSIVLLVGGKIWPNFGLCATDLVVVALQLYSDWLQDSDSFALWQSHDTRFVKALHKESQVSCDCLIGGMTNGVGGLMLFHWNPFPSYALWLNTLLLSQLIHKINSFKFKPITKFGNKQMLISYSLGGIIGILIIFTGGSGVLTNPWIGSVCQIILF